MDINFAKIDKEESEAFEILIDWYNDSRIRPFLVPNLNGVDYNELTVADVMLNAKMKPSKTQYLIKDGQLPIGEIGVDTEFKHLVDSSVKTGWINILIGNTDYWGKGVANLAMDFLEKECIDLGCKRIELGIFGFNKRAIAFYRKLGYVEIRKDQQYTLSSGRWIVDIRMEKKIV